LTELLFIENGCEVTLLLNLCSFQVTASCVSVFKVMNDVQLWLMCSSWRPRTSSVWELSCHWHSALERYWSLHGITSCQLYRSLSCWA